MIGGGGASLIKMLYLRYWVNESAIPLLLLSKCLSGGTRGEKWLQKHIGDTISSVPTELHVQIYTSRKNVLVYEVSICLLGSHKKNVFFYGQADPFMVWALYFFQDKGSRQL